MKEKEKEVRTSKKMIYEKLKGCGRGERNRTMYGKNSKTGVKFENGKRK